MVRLGFVVDCVCSYALLPFSKKKISVCARLGFCNSCLSLVVVAESESPEFFSR